MNATPPGRKVAKPRGKQARHGRAPKPEPPAGQPALPPQQEPGPAPTMAAPADMGVGASAEPVPTPDPVPAPEPEAPQAEPQTETPPAPVPAQPAPPMETPAPQPAPQPQQERREDRWEGRRGRDRRNERRDERRERQEQRREGQRPPQPEMGPPTRGLTLLGAKTTVYSDQYTPAILEAFDNRHPGNDFFVKFNCPEFTSLCPITGQPDFATIYISYIPDKKMVESKSLKLYLFSFRNHGAFHEDCVNIILEDLVKLLAPRYLEVWGKFLPRGGLSIDPFANYGRPSTRWEEFARQRLLMHDLNPERVDNR